MFQGSMVALVTPFRGGQIDEQGLRRLIEFQIEQGTDVICPCGTTGESATLSFAEHQRIVEITVETVSGRIPVMAGTGSNNTEEAVLLTRHAKEAGASAALLITPYYNRPTQEGLFLHFKKIAEAVDLPLVLYNVPSRTGVNMLPETVERLAAIANIVGIKEASGSIAQGGEIVSRCGDAFDVLSGDDVNALPLMAVGGKGVISVTANIAQQAVAAMVRAWQAGRSDEARQQHLALIELNNAMFLQTNPIPVQAALGMMGLVSPAVRLPLCQRPDALHATLKNALQKYGLIAS